MHDARSCHFSNSFVYHLAWLSQGLFASPGKRSTARLRPQVTISRLNYCQLRCDKPATHHPLAAAYLLMNICPVRFQKNSAPPSPGSSSRPARCKTMCVTNLEQSVEKRGLLRWQATFEENAAEESEKASIVNNLIMLNFKSQS